MIPAQDFESLVFSEVDGSTLDDLLTGSRITGAEPIEERYIIRVAAI